MMRWACVTDYEGLYARNYFAHGPGASSFDINYAPAILATASRRVGGAVLDIGGGSGLLAERLQGEGVKTFTFDTANRSDPNYLRIDLSQHDPTIITKAARTAAEVIGDRWLTTCLDVAEHIDREHIADFLLNLAYLTPSECIISISTRPSSQANRFHSTVIPIDTWRALVELVGFNASDFAELNDDRSTKLFSGADASIAAPAHWQRIRPFREHPSHKHHLRLERARPAPDTQEFRADVSTLLDLDYRAAKRRQVRDFSLPPLIFSVHFIQDWSFARSLLDAWPADRVALLFRRDTIAGPLLSMLESLAVRLGVRHATISSVAEGSNLLDEWGVGDSALFVTATEGVRYITHLTNSRLVLEARKRGAQTICLQHGMSINRSQAPASATLATWDEGSCAALKAHVAEMADVSVACTGSPKCLDALSPRAKGALAWRFGRWAADFERTVLVGLNLHWSVHEHDAPETIHWLRRLADVNPQTLLVVRPHPDDTSLYAHGDLFDRPNILIIDEMALLTMDLPVARLLCEVDAVLTTTSSLIIDAAAARRPLALLPAQQAWRTPGAAWLPVSSPLREDPPSITAADWDAGTLPSTVTGGVPPEVDDAWFAPSREVFTRLLSLDRSTAPMAPAVDRINNGLGDAIASVNFDQHPHPNRSLVAQAIGKFVTT